MMLLIRPGGRGGQFDPIHAFDQSPQHGMCFEPCQTLSGAGVRAVAEAELAGGVASYIEGIR
jgi:hypothetical protein